MSASHVVESVSAPAASQDTFTSVPTSTASGQVADDSNGSALVIVIIVAVVIVVIVVIIAVVCVRRYIAKKRSSTIVKAVPVDTAAVSSTETSSTAMEIEDNAESKI